MAQSLEAGLPHPGRTYEGFQPGRDGIPEEVNEQCIYEGILYDLRRDPGEQYYVRESYPEIVEKLEQNNLVKDAAFFLS